MDNVSEYFHDVNTVLGEFLISYILREGILNETDLRDIKIRYDFKKLLQEGTSKRTAIRTLSKAAHYSANERIYFLSMKTLQKITSSIGKPCKIVHVKKEKSFKRKIV